MTAAVKAFLNRFITETEEWAHGKNWLIRIPFLIYFSYILFRHLNNPDYNSIIWPLNFGIHEVGHLIFTPLGHTMHMWGGTIFQCTVPILGMWNFYRQKDFFSIFLCFGWLSTNFFDVARYISDARTMAIPLVSPFGMDAIHDWNYILSRLGLLQYDTFLGGVLRILAVLSMLICLLGGGIILLLMTGKKRAEE